MNNVVAINARIGACYLYQDDSNSLDIIYSSIWNTKYIEWIKKGTMIHTHYLDLATRLKNEVVLNKKKKFSSFQFCLPKRDPIPWLMEF
jgi:hypothetical protein